MGLFGNLFGKPQYANPNMGAPMDPSMMLPGAQQQAAQAQSPASGLFGQQATQQLQQPMSQMVQQPPAAPEKSGHNWAGIAADFMAGLAGRTDRPYGDQLASQRDFSQKQLLQQAAAMNTLQREKFLTDYKNTNPGPTDLQQKADYYKSIGRPDLADSLLTNAATAPPIVTNNPDGTHTVYAQGAIPRGPAPLPTAPVGKLTPINGGPMPQASGGFRPGW